MFGSRTQVGDKVVRIEQPNKPGAGPIGGSVVSAPTNRRNDGSAFVDVQFEDLDGHRLSGKTERTSLNDLRPDDPALFNSEVVAGIRGKNPEK